MRDSELLRSLLVAPLEPVTNNEEQPNYQQKQQTTDNFQRTLIKHQPRDYLRLRETDPLRLSIYGALYVYLPERPCLSLNLFN
jgi:hypothetical protein